MNFINFGFFLIPSALIGVVCNWTVVFSVLKISSLKQSFGYLTANQALGDAIHCTAFLFYVCPMMILDIELFRIYSNHCGFVLIFCYELSVLSHLIISFNRLTAVYMPTKYSSMFSLRNSIIIIVILWITTAMFTIYFYQYLCPLFWVKELGLFMFRSSDFCAILSWYTDFCKFIVCISLVVIFDIVTVAKVHSINKLTCFQGAAFVFELVSYFVVPLFLADNKIALFFLTTFAWVSVHSIDGIITVLCNPDLRKFITFRREKSNQVSSTNNAHQHRGEQRSEIPHILSTPST
ncbi:unnamed protein product [Caenorhabditis bovis]|uniref:G-protein coupled receptors family 1 profile domain-containing protein n=1 Tax=Caenorhabditis bovis TaxID=2654633 RepID=A0A8S1EAW5_9PELO|nr:unnamed protein product [Caenorhabditis bovis]